MNGILFQIAKQIIQHADDLRTLAARLSALDEQCAQCSEGIPMLTAVRLPLLNLDKPWYEATQRYGPFVLPVTVTDQKRKPLSGLKSWGWIL